MPNRASSCWRACLLSLALHGAAAGLAGFLYMRNGAVVHHEGPIVMDTIVEGPDSDAEVHLALDSAFSHETKPARVVWHLHPPGVAPAVPSVTTAESLPPLGRTQTQFGSETAVTAPPPGGNEGEGRRTTTSFFRIGAQGRHVVYVLDRSLSMGLNGGLSVVRRELCSSLARLPADAYFQVIFYNRQAETLCIGGSRGLLSASEANKREAARLVEALTAEGGTEHLSALRLALALRPDVIYFLTDADGLPGEQVRAVTLLNQGSAAIDAIELCTTKHDSGETALGLLARNNRGAYRRVLINEER